MTINSTITPSIVDAIEYQLPESVRAQENELLVKFLKYYYDWLSQRGQPAEFIQNIMSYHDIDLSSAEFAQYLSASIISLVPASAKMDIAVLTKHISDFLRSKGTFESFQFIMNAVYGEIIEMEWNADKVLRPSANEYSRSATMAVASSDVWTDITGSLIEQYHPTVATATIESYTSTTVNGKLINWLKLDDKTVIGEFAHSVGKVKVLKNTIDRTRYEVREEEYFTPISYSEGLIRFRERFETTRPYEGLLVKQLNSTFRGFVDTFVARSQSTTNTLITLRLRAVTGTFVPGEELYIVSSTLEYILYVKTDFEYGVVSPSLGNVRISHPGSLYEVGDAVSFLQGSGVNAAASVAETTVGGVTEVNISKKGYGYSVGDKLNTIALDSGGNGFTAAVSSIDGIGAKIQIISELNGVSFSYGGTGFKVNDELVVIGGVSVAGTPPARIKVLSVASTWSFIGVGVEQQIRYVSGGFGRRSRIVTRQATGASYSPYTKLALINTTTNAIIAGFAAKPTIVNGEITAVTVTSTPTISTNTLAVVANGYGAEIALTLSGGQVIGATIIKGGVNYIDPIITVTGNGVGAVLLAVASAGVITSASVVTQGVSYTEATGVVSERHGSGAKLYPLFSDQTLGIGSILTHSIIEPGQYLTLPKCDNIFLNKVVVTDNVLMTMENGDTIITEDGLTIERNIAAAYDTQLTQISSGLIEEGRDVISLNGEVGDLNFRAKSALINDEGQFYKTVTTAVSGRGTGATFIAFQTLGVITSVIVTNGGKDYYRGTTITIPGGTTQCVLSPVIINGVISSVTVVSGGTGYTPPELTGLTINSGSNITLSTTISGDGKIVNYDIINRGVGYSSQTEIIPISIVATGGTGAKFLPSISSDGKIIKVIILDGGSGYQISDTIAVTGGVGSGAVLKPLVFAGKVVNVIIENTGTNYRYGTYIIVVGDGSNAAITPVVETGITHANVLAKGDYYRPETEIVITDPTGTGAVLQPVVIDGKMESIRIINKGVGYTNPVLTTINSGSGVGGVITAYSQRHIASLTIVNAGVGYTYADVLIVGDGADADFNLTVEKLGSLQTVTVGTVGAGYVSTPVVTITDVSGFGAVSGVRITNIGAGYRKLPLVELLPKYDTFGNVTATGTKFTCFGEKIGGIKRVAFTEHGADYFNSPHVVFDMRAILRENASFKVNETVKVQSGIYRTIYEHDIVIMESGDTLESEASVVVVMDADDTSANFGVTATVSEFNFASNTIKLKGLSDNFFLISETIADIITEDGLEIIDQASGTIDEGDVIVGEKSASKGTLQKINRAIGSVELGGNGWSEFSFTNDVGMLNNLKSVLHDNTRYQDRAYVIKAGLAFKEYERILKATVHPAGYAMFGDVKTQTMAEANILNEIGYQQLVTLITIISFVLNDFDSERGYMDELFGEFSKFKYTHYINHVKDYNIEASSVYVSGNVNQYVAIPLSIGAIQTWDVINGVQILLNSGTSPAGGNTMIQLSDLSTLLTATLSKTFTSVTGNTYTFEAFVGKQINPQTYPEFSLGNTYVRFNTETGAFFTNGTGLVTVKYMGDYWWIRIGEVATGTSLIASTVPARGAIGDFSVTSNNSIGSIKVSDVYVRNITALTSYNMTLRALNSKYIPDRFNFMGTESDIVQVVYANSSTAVTNGADVLASSVGAVVASSTAVTNGVDVLAAAVAS